MTQEEKELLLKDLCARLPYGVKFPVECWNDELLEFNEQSVTLYSINTDLYSQTLEGDGNIYIEDIKPYLFPMSSMTAEQVRKFYRIKGLNLTEEELIQFKSNYLSVVTNITTYNWSIDFLNKNHFDYRGLIEKGLAIDATGLNIY